MKQTLVDASKQAYVTTTENPSHDELRTGLLQRIATATELMARTHVHLQSEIEYLKKERDRLKDRSETLKRQLAAAKGQITRLKNKS